MHFVAWSKFFLQTLFWKIWVQHLGAHINSTVQKYVLVQHWTNQQGTLWCFTFILFIVSATLRAEILKFIFYPSACMQKVHLCKGLNFDCRHTSVKYLCLIKLKLTHVKSFFIKVFTCVIVEQNQFEVSFIEASFKLFIIISLSYCNHQKYLQIIFICDALCDLVSVTIWHSHGHSNTCECMQMLFSTFMSFLSICVSSHGIRTGLSNVKRLNAIQTGKH